VSPSDTNLPPVAYEDAPKLHPVYVIHPPHRRYWLHLLLFLLTVFTTLMMGARLQHNFMHGLAPFRVDKDFFPLPWILAEPRNLLLGIPFSLTLMSILLAHELGHFLYCVRYRVYATLPFFIPAPTLIGTFGAFIRIKAPIPGRRALFDIAVAGPIAGFALAAPAAVLGLMLSKYAPALVEQSDVPFGYPLLFHLLHAVLPAASGGDGGFALSGLYLHPIAVAAWIGMLATALNLLPGGQLDGGHLVYAAAPHLHRPITRGLTVLLIPMAVLLWQGWFLWAVFLALMGSRHPQVSVIPALDARRRALALLAVIILVLTFMPVPIAGGSLLEAWHDYQR
jgi:membrane-associated protease RseP (regulator of RpoE activity)